ncbi:Protein of unknown function DUF58 [Halogranum rubrum]|uniref:DUF58 domain-containing protein n=2 Tax=Halogranum rubrum TaxID=553466 RepID=A0A1I4IK27_9EURY|nr:MULTISPECIES: DUF58 domain-containing protein [Halogranum]EJN57179.1 hypothetical protein HSB1_45650 [Halogranum salarium B-1]SFL54759.1 Protein of unknown function DUF58 [Halogranum rubrum]
MITPEFLDEIEAFATAKKRRISAIFQGEQAAPMVGEGLTFKDYRPYAPGDDTRLIDWRVYARTDDLFIKQYEAERNLTVHVLLDESASMAFGEGETNKYDYAAKLGLGFSYLTAAEGNDFRFAVFGESAERLDGGRSNRGAILELVELLNERTPTAQTDFVTSFEEYAATIHTKSLVLVASDCLTDPAVFGEALDALATHHLVVAGVLTPDEWNPSAAGDTRFEDVESPQQLRTYFGSRLRNRYRERLSAHVTAVADECQDRGAVYVPIDTGDEFFDSFTRVWTD